MDRFVREIGIGVLLALAIGVAAAPAAARQDDSDEAEAAALAAAAEAEAALAEALANAHKAFGDRDYAGALELFLPLAEDGNAEAQTQLGLMYRTGLLGMADYDQAAMWFEAAVAQHHPDALFNLGLMYFQHELEPISGPVTRYALSEAAFVRFHEAARLGHADAQLYLGHMFAEGMGVDRDPIEAYKWYQLAAWQRNSLATSARDRLSGKLSSDELNQAKASARAFQTAAEASQPPG